MSFLEGGYLSDDHNYGFMEGGYAKGTKKHGTKRKTTISGIVTSLNPKQKKEYTALMNTIRKENPKKSLETRRKIVLGMLDYDPVKYHVSQRLERAEHHDKSKLNKLSSSKYKQLHQALKSIGLGYYLP